MLYKSKYNVDFLLINRNSATIVSNSGHIRPKTSRPFSILRHLWDSGRQKAMSHLQGEFSKILKNQ